MDGASIYEEDGKVYYRASTLGAPCTKALVAIRMGYTEVQTRDEKVLEKYAAGRELEESVISLMKDEGWVIWGEQNTVDLALTGRLVVRGHIDGYGMLGEFNPEGDRYIVEVKTQTIGQWESFEKYGWESGFFPRYAWQVSAYMLASGLPLALVRGLRSEDNSLIEKIDVRFYDHPFFTKQNILKRVLNVEIAAGKSEVPDGCNGHMYPCPVPYLCTGVEREQVEDDADAVVEAAALTFKIAEGDRKSAQQRYDDSKSALLGLLGVGKRAETSSGVRVSTWEQGSGARRLSVASERALTFLLWWFWGINLEEMKEQSRGSRVKVTLPKSMESNEGNNEQSATNE